MYSEHLDRYKSLNNKDTAKLLAVALVITLILDSHGLVIASSISTGITKAVSTIRCMCLGAEPYSITIEGVLPPATYCGSGDLDHCSCELDGQIIRAVDIPHIDWLTDIDRLELDLSCSTHNAREKRDTEKATEVAVQKKSNILSRTIHGAGDVVNGTGNFVANSIDGAGAAASSVIGGSVRLVGYATRSVAGLAAGTINAVGNVFQGSTTTEVKRLRRDLGAQITSNEGMKEAAKQMVAAGDVITTATSNIARILNEHDDLGAAKEAFNDLISSETNPALREMYTVYRDALMPVDVDHEVETIEVIDRLAHINTVESDSSSEEKGTWQQIKDLRTHISHSRDIYDVLLNLNRAGDNLGAYEELFRENLSTRLHKELSCASLDGNLAIGRGITLADVGRVLEARSKICNTENSSVDSFLKEISANEDKIRSKRSTTDQEPATAKKKVKKSKTLKKRKAKVAKAKAPTVAPDSGAEEVEDEVIETEDGAHEVLAEEDITDEPECVCDPDTHRRLH